MTLLESILKQRNNAAVGGFESKNLSHKFVLADARLCNNICW